MEIMDVNASTTTDEQLETTESNINVSDVTELLPSTTDFLAKLNPANGHRPIVLFGTNTLKHDLYELLYPPIGVYNNLPDGCHWVAFQSKPIPNEFAKHARRMFNLRINQRANVFVAIRMYLSFLHDLLLSLCESIHPCTLNFPFSTTVPIAEFYHLLGITSSST